MDIRIHALMRPRFGDFCYTRHEIDILCQDIRTFRKLGADAAVIGALKPDGTLDVEAMKRMIDAAGDMSITLHRAFDVCRDPFEALETAKELGVNTILTSGQRKSAKEGVEILKQLALKADGKVDIMAGARNRCRCDPLSGTKDRDHDLPYVRENDTGQPYGYRKKDQYGTAVDE